MELNDTIKTQLAHRSIRAFKDEPLTQEQIDTLVEVARWTPSSTGQQRSSLIRVTDPNLKKEISKVSTQAYVGTTPELWIFVIDLYRNEQIAKAKGADTTYANDADKFIQGFTDAILAAQNVEVAAESMGLGTVFIGSILNDPQKMVELLHLPKLTFPILGILIGKPDQEPQLKPRIPNELRVFENGYKILDNYLDEFADYDAEMSTYYDMRDLNKRVDCFTDQVVTRIAGVPARQRVMSVLKAQGFNFD